MINFGSGTLPLEDPYLRNWLPGDGEAGLRVGRQHDDQSSVAPGKLTHLHHARHVPDHGATMFIFNPLWCVGLPNY